MLDWAGKAAAQKRVDTDLGIVCAEHGANGDFGGLAAAFQNQRVAWR